MYIVTGYAFLKTFHFVALKQNTIDLEHLLTASLVIGFIYNNIAYIIPISTYEFVEKHFSWLENSYLMDNIIIILSSILLGYIFARVLRTKYMIHFLDFLKIRDTGNVYLWDDLMDNINPMKAVITYDQFIYEGIVHCYESYSNAPHIALSSYIIKDIKNNISEDYSNNNTKIIILDTAKANSVSIIYFQNNGKNEICKDLSLLCKSHKDFKKQEEQES